MAIEFAVVNGTTRTNNGTKDYTSSGFGTPTAAIIMLGNTGPAPLSNPAPAIWHSVGFTDGTNQATCGIRVDDNVSSSSTHRESSTNLVGVLAQATSTQEISFSAWTTDGITLSFTWSFLPRDMTVILIKGTTNAKVVNFTVTGTTANDITTVGFKPDLVMPITIGHGTAIIGTTQAVISVGAIHNSSTDTVTQACIGFNSPNAQGTIQCDTTVRNDAGILQIFNGAISWRGSFSDFDANGFSVTPNVNPGGDYIFALCLEAADPDEISVDIITSPTSTGTYSVTAPGFEALFGMIYGSAVQTINTIETDQDGGVFGMSAFDGTTEHFCGFTEQDNAGTSNNQCNMSHSDCVDLKKWNGSSFASFYQGSFSSFQSNGYDLSFPTTVDATARQWISIAFKAEAVVEAAVRAGSMLAAKHVRRSMRRGR